MGFKLLDWFKRPPDIAIGGWEDPYLFRWYLIPRNRFFNIYLHKFLRDDDDRALHDHPWYSVSLLLKGGYWEHVYIDPEKHPEEYQNPYGNEVLSVQECVRRYTGDVIFRSALHRHRIELINGKPAWTIFMTGPKIRDWGFWCPQGFVHWEKFTAPGDSSKVGKGCAQ